jgi:uncharacterized protein GlcG (DUF336 family)
LSPSASDAATADCGTGSIVIRHGDGGVLSAVGVGGSTPDQDRECWNAGITAIPQLLVLLEPTAAD